VFQLTPSGNLTTLVAFNSSNGFEPRGLIQGSNGDFYGTTELGGAISEGTVFQLTPSGNLTTLTSFNGSDSAYPNAGLIQGSNGDFYGTTFLGRGINSRKGTVYVVNFSQSVPEPDSLLGALTVSGILIVRLVKPNRSLL